MNKYAKCGFWTAAAAGIAEMAIGGIGVVAMGGAIGVPAAAVAGTVGAGVAAKMLWDDLTKEPTRYVKVTNPISGLSVHFIIDEDGLNGSYYYQYPTYSTDKKTASVQELRVVMKNLLNQGFIRA